MKRILLLTITLIFGAIATAQTVSTPNIGLQLPAYHSNNWNVPLNYNFTQLDRLLSGQQTLPGLGLGFANVSGLGTFGSLKLPGITNANCLGTDNVGNIVLSTCTLTGVVTSFNTRVGPVTLQLADVTGLGTLANDISGLAAHASALNATPTLCTGGQVPTGILANGNATGCFTPAGTSPAGSNYATQYNAGSGTFGGTGPGTSGWVLTSNGPSAAPTYQAPASSGVASFNTRFGAVTLLLADVTGLGTLANDTSGNAATATQLAASPTLCSSGQAPTGIDAHGNATGCASIGGSPAPTPFSYTLKVVTGTISAYDNTTNSGTPVTTGSDLAVVLNSLLSTAANVGATFYFKPGTYNINSATQESTGGYTLYYSIGIPSPNSGSNYPSFTFTGGVASVGSQNSGPGSGVIFNVTSTAESAAGAGNVLAAMWQRPNLVANTNYPYGTLYWNNSVYVNNITVQFPSNARGKEEGFNFLEASYLQMNNVMTSFVSYPSSRGAVGSYGVISPGNPADGAFLNNVQVQPGFDVGISINSEHSYLNSTVVFHATTGYTYAEFASRNNGNIYHNSTWISPQVYDCQNDITAGSHIASGSQLDIIGYDLEYETSGQWSHVNGFNTGANLAGLITWSNSLTITGRGALTTPFTSGTGTNYCVESNGILSGACGRITNTTVAISSGSQAANSCSTTSTVTLTGLTTSMVVEASYSANPSALVGWGSTGGMVFQIWPSASNTATYQICNQTSSSISYSAITFNVGAR